MLTYYYLILGASPTPSLPLAPSATALVAGVRGAASTASLHLSSLLYHTLYQVHNAISLPLADTTTSCPTGYTQAGSTGSTGGLKLDIGGIYQWVVENFGSIFVVGLLYFLVLWIMSAFHAPWASKAWEGGKKLIIGFGLLIFFFSIIGAFGSIAQAGGASNITCYLPTAPTPGK